MQQLDLEFDTIDSLRQEIYEIKVKENKLLNLKMKLEETLEATCKHPVECWETKLEFVGQNIQRRYINYCGTCGKKMTH